MNTNALGNCGIKQPLEQRVVKSEKKALQFVLATPRAHFFGYQAVARKAYARGSWVEDVPR